MGPWVSRQNTATNTIASNLAKKIEDLTIDISRAYSVIAQECGQTLARVRVSWTYISIVIISLQWIESMWLGSHMI